MAKKPTGNKPKDYKERSADERTEEKRVAAWKRVIERAAGILEMERRSKDAEVGDEFLSGKKTTKKAKKVYQNYLLPLLEAEHRSALPVIPDVGVEARDERSVAFERAAASLLDASLRTPYNEKRIRDAQWDDDRSGFGIVKTVWQVELDDAKPAVTQDPEQLAIEVDRAEAENRDILGAQVAEVDIDFVHIQMHQQMQFPPGPEAAAMAQHLAEHAARQAVILHESAKLERVPWYMFYYDPDVPWEDRAWESELRSEKIQDLVSMGFSNINENNLPAEIKNGETGDMPYWMRTARVHHIHDRLTNEWIVIPADGPDEAKILYQGKWPYGNIDIYVPLVGRPWKPEDAYGMSVVQQCIPALERLALVDFYIDRHVEQHPNYKVFFGGGAGSDVLKAGMNDPDQHSVSTSMEVLAGMKEYKPPAIPDTLLLQWDRLMGALRHIVGADVQETGASNPHAISATESAERGTSSDSRGFSRQEIMSDFLGKIARNFLQLYKKFATQAVLVTIIGAEGPSYEQINPAELPESIDLYLDVKAESQAAKVEANAQADQFVTYLQGLATLMMPVDWMEVTRWLGKVKGIARPLRFITAGAPLGAPPEQGGGPPQPGEAAVATPGETRMGMENDRGFAPDRETLTG